MFPLTQYQGTDARSADNKLKMGHWYNDSNKLKINWTPVETNEKEIFSSSNRIF